MPSITLINNSEFEGENVHLRVDDKHHVLTPGMSACFKSDAEDWRVDVTFWLQTDSVPVPYYDERTREQITPKPTIEWIRGQTLEDWEREVGVPLDLTKVTPEQSESEE